VSAFTESVVERAALAWLEGVGWNVRHGAEIAPGETAAERDEYGRVVLAQRLRDALARLNPALPAEALDDAFRKLTRLGLDTAGADLIVRNRALHRLLVDGLTVDYRLPAGQAGDAEGSIRGALARETDFDDPAGSDWLAMNRFSVIEVRRSRGAGGHARCRPRVVQALGHHRGRHAGRRAHARATGVDRGPVRAMALFGR